MMRQVIYDQEKFSRVDYDIRKAIFTFLEWAERDLVDEDFDDFWFRMKFVDDDVILLYLMYKPEEDERILTWHIYLQSRLNEVFKHRGVDLGDLQVLVVVESYDLWND